MNTSKNKNEIFKKSLDIILKTITLMVISNYILSYYVIYNIFKLNGITDFSLITIEDLPFYILNTNTQIFSLFSFSYFLLFFYRILGATENDFKGFFNRIKPKSCCIYILHFTLFLLLIYLFIHFYQSIITFFFNKYNFIFLAIILSPVVIYTFIEKFRNSIILIQYFFIIFAMMLVYKFSFDDLKNNSLNSNNKIITYYFKKDTITTSKNLRLILSGSRYLILKDSKKDETLIYNTKDIKKIKFSKVIPFPK